jgi:hypothetical protein
MLTIAKTKVYGWESAIRGMRNAMNSWPKMDSYQEFTTDGMKFVLGPNDADLARRLCKAGPSHAKFRRMITVYMDINAPFYWWKEYDTYKVGTVANSCSTMHKIHSRDLALADFSWEHLVPTSVKVLEAVIDEINFNRAMFLQTKDKKYWYRMIQLLPTSYNQLRTLELNYEVLANIYETRRHHKLDEWHTVCDCIEKLPYSWIITGKEPEDGKA